MKQPTVTEHELQAFIDQRLEPARQREVEAILAATPELAAQAAAYRAQNRGLHALFDAVLDEPIPTAMQMPPPRPSWAWGARYAAGLMLVLAGGMAGWFLHGAQSGAASMPTLAHQAAIAHVVYSPDVRRPVEIGADQEVQLVNWLSKRTGVPMRPPKLGTVGYQLVGGRLLPGQSGPVAQFMYEDASGQRLTLYVSTDQSHNTDTGFRFAREGDVNVFYWIDGKLGYALSAGMDKGALARIANVVYEQLETGEK